MIEPPCTCTFVARAVSRRNSYASPPGSFDPFAGSTSALAARVARSPPSESQTSGRLTMSGRSCVTAWSISRRAWAMLSALFAPGFICITLTRIHGLRFCRGREAYPPPRRNRVASRRPATYVAVRYRRRMCAHVADQGVGPAGAAVPLVDRGADRRRLGDAGIQPDGLACVVRLRHSDAAAVPGDLGLRRQRHRALQPIPEKPHRRAAAPCAPPPPRGGP